MNRTQGSWAFIAAFLGIAAWILVVKTGERLPYLVTPFSRNVRAMLVFPVLLAALAWLVYGYRWRQTGLTGYAMHMAKLGSKTDRIKQTILSACGLLLLPAAVSWTSVYFTAWAAYSVANSPFAETYRIVDKQPTTRGFALEMRNHATDSTVSLRVSSELAGDLRSGTIVCASGRSSAFGTVVESLVGTHCAGAS